MKGYVTQRQRALLAYDVFEEVLDTAGWLREWMRGPFESVDLTPQGFRLLVLLLREGPTRMMDAAKKLRFRRPNLDAVLRRLEKRGWVRRVIVTLPTEDARAKRSRARTLGPRRRNWKVGVLVLTPDGRRFLKKAFANNSKVLKALMRALHVREQRTLIEICRKLRAGAILKFISEITHLDEWEEAEEAQEAQEAEDVDEVEEEG